MDKSKSNIPKPETVELDPTSFVDWYPNMIEPEKADRMLEYLLNGIEWKTVERTTDKGTYTLPRKQHWMADSDVETSLFQKGERLPWNDLILELKTLVEKIYYPQTFDYVLMNLYRDGDDMIGAHSDGDHHCVIPSFSFGATRKFIVIPAKGNKPKYKYQLSHRSLIVMRGDMQKGWKHMIPVEKDVKTTRVTLLLERVEKAFISLIREIEMKRFI